MADLTPERLAELRAHLAIILDDRHEHEMDGTIDQSHGALTEALPELLDEIDRLRAVIRETHAPCVRVQNNYRTEHMVHQPGCKLYEIEP